MADFKEYTRQRDIAVKRLKRMGVEAHIPTVKELKSGVFDVQTAFTNLFTFVESGISLSRIKAKERELISPEEIRSKRNEQARLRRRIKKAEEFRETSGKESGNYRAFLKGAKRLGVDIKPSEVPAFLAYMDYRFSQGAGAFAYAFASFIEDYEELKQKGYSPSQMIGDYERFIADQAGIRDRYNAMEGVSSDSVIESWNRFMNR